MNFEPWSCSCGFGRRAASPLGGREESIGEEKEATGKLMIRGTKRERGNTRMQHHMWLSLFLRVCLCSNI